MLIAIIRSAYTSRPLLFADGIELSAGLGAVDEAAVLTAVKTQSTNELLVGVGVRMAVFHVSLSVFWSLKTTTALLAVRYSHCLARLDLSLIDDVNAIYVLNLDLRFMLVSPNAGSFPTLVCRRPYTQCRALGIRFDARITTPSRWCGVAMHKGVF